MNRIRDPWVLKAGGRELLPGPSLAELSQRVRHWVGIGQRLVVVHGGGEEVSRRASELGLTTVKHGGLRVTDAATLEVVAEVLVGRVGVRLVNCLESAGVPAVGLSGVSDQLLTVTPAGDPPGSLGWVGIPQRVRPGRLHELLAHGVTPVLAPLGTDGRGGVYNVNADLAAGAVAASLHAGLLLLTDVPAVRDARGDALGEIGEADVLRLLHEGAATDGMIPKLEAARAALVGGATSVWIGDLDGLGDDGPRPGAGTRLVPTSRLTTGVHHRSRAGATA